MAAELEVLTETRDVGDERQEFLERRTTGLGATDSPKILGLSRWGTPRTVYRDKTEPRDDEMSLPAWLGLKMQNTVAELYTAATAIRVRADNRHHRHPEHAWMVCHLDFRAWRRPNLLIETKTKASMRGWGPEGTTQIPADVWVQVQHEMAVTGATEAHVAVLFGHHTFRVYAIPRDDEFIGRLIPKLSDFWHLNVLARVPPPPTGREVDTEDVKRDNPEALDPQLKSATPEQVMLINRLKVARIELHEAETNEQELENKVKELIGDAAGITGTFGTITWKNDRDREVIDWEHVAVNQGNVIEALLELLDDVVAGAELDEAWRSRLGMAQLANTTTVSLATRKVKGSRRFLARFEED